MTSILRNILRPVADVIVQFLCVNMIFACSLGLVVSAVAVLQFIVFVSLFYGAGLLYPLTTPVMIADFKAVGGILMPATGFRMIHVKMFPTGDMIPAMMIAMPVSWLWTTYIAPLAA